LSTYGGKFDVSFVYFYRVEARTPCGLSRGAVYIIGYENCPIRKYSRMKEFDTWAICDEYESCEMLNGFYNRFPQAKATLDAVRQR
jgi:hypothetical protein